MIRVVVIGGGAGGMLAAGRAAECGAKVILLERNSILGKKLRITGKGRGNVTNIAELDDFVSAFGPNGKFLYGAFSRFSNDDLISLLERLGVPTKVERGGRVFPQSDRASDVADALERWLRELRVDIRLGTRVHGLVVEKKDQGGGDNEETPSKKSRSYSPALFSSFISGVRVFSGVIPADAVVLATGGITYPRTGSTGDGYRIAAEVGHTIVPPKPSLAALETAEPWVSQLQGLSLRNVTATLFSEKKKLAIEFGEMLFTHFGVSGPIILTLSKVYAGLSHKSGVSVSINLKPALSREQLESRLISDFSQKKQFKNYLPALLPRTLIPVFINLSGIPADLPVNRITKTQRKKIIDLLMDFRLQITGARPAEEAIVTSGGVSLKEIDPRTMGSLLVYGLHFAGEVIDIDATTGGYNLQAAFTTGWIAGESAANVLCATKKTQESNS
ncbi:MAG: NAD(P)/FAD-dependent oxidoreductase [Armatimonadetes bacterium]|nr:NAD(P)/FAD-dependent oxidoreductase [Armatimonadota bacterium]